MVLIHRTTMFCFDSSQSHIHMYGYIYKALLINLMQLLVNIKPNRLPDS